MKRFCINETRISYMTGDYRVTRWTLTYRDADGWEWIETVTKRESVG